MSDSDRLVHEHQAEGCLDCYCPAGTLNALPCICPPRARSDLDRRRLKPYIVTRDGSIVDRATGVEIGHVHRNDYGWHAELKSGVREPMHATRRQACDSAWGRRSAAPPPLGRRNPDA